MDDSQFCGVSMNSEKPMFPCAVIFPPFFCPLISDPFPAALETQKMLINFLHL